MPKFNFHILPSFSFVLFVGRLLGGYDFNDKSSAQLRLFTQCYLGLWKTV